MPHKSWKLLLSFWTTVMLLTLAGGSNAQGAPFKRIPVDKCYEFWESGVKRHLLNHTAK